MRWPALGLAAASAATAGLAGAVAADDERAAPPDPFVVTTPAGMRLAGAPARLDIRHPQGGPVVAELTFSASDPAGRVWNARLLASAETIAKRRLSATISDRPLVAGRASVQTQSGDAEAVFARAGAIRVVLQAGRLTGETSGTSERFAARFEGPFAVSCAVPAAALTGAASSPAEPQGPGALVVDDSLASAPCRPYAALAGPPR